MKSSLYLLLTAILHLLASAIAQQDNPYSTDYIEQTVASLENDIRNKREFIQFYDTRRTEYMKLRSEFRSQLFRKQVQLYAQDYQNVFNLSTTYKDVSTFPRQYREQVTSAIQLDKIIDTARSDLRRVQSLKDYLETIDTRGFEPDLAARRNQAIEYCNTLIAINRRLIAHTEEDSGKFQELGQQINKLGEEGRALKSEIQDTLTQQSLTLASYIRKWDTFLPVFKKTLESTYSSDDDSNLRNRELSFLLNALLIGIAVSFAGSWVLFGRTFKRILVNRGAFVNRGFMILLGTLLIFSLFLASLNAFVDLSYYRRVTALGPEFLLTVMIVVFALAIRLDQNKFWTALRLYLPMIFICGVLIALRLALAPNVIVRIVLPVITPLMATLNAWYLYKIKDTVPRLDRIMGGISLVFLIVCSIMSWAGYAFMAFLLLLFWNILLCSILLIVTLIAILQHYCQKREEKTKRKEKPWFAPFIRKLILPYLSVFLLLFSMYWPMEVFDLGDDFTEALNSHNIAAESINVSGETNSWSGSNSLARNITPNSIIAIILLGITVNYLLYLGKRWLREIYDDKYQSGGVATLVTLGSLVVWIIYAIVSLFILKANFNGIFVVLGGMSLGLGFALKDTIENLISGVSLMFGRLRQGDYVECDGIRGRVTTLGYRTTYIETLDGSIIAFQNTQLFNKNFRNLTQNHLYESAGIQVGVAYSTDFEQVQQIILDAIHNVSLVSKTRSPAIFLDSFGDSAIVINVIVWVPVPSKGGALSQVRQEIYKALNENKISIPFPQQDIYVKEFPVTPEHLDKASSSTSHPSQSASST